MNKYAVTLIRTVTQTCVLNVMADNGIDAVDTAIAARGGKDWQQTEGEEPETFYREVKEVRDECPNCGVLYDADVEDHKDCGQCNRLAPDTMPHGEDENCSTCGARPGETHPNGCADHIESEEKNITETFGTRDQWEAELNIEYDGDDLVSWCHVSTKRGNQEYCSSIGVVESFGTVEGDNDGDVMLVPKYVFNAIHKWALENGY